MSGCRLILLCLFVAVLYGCATTHKKDENYVAYIELLKEQSKREDARAAGITALAAECQGDARCVEHVAAVAALAQVGGMKTPAPEQYRPQQSFTQQFALGLVGQLAPLAGAAVSWHQADKNAQVSIAQYRYLDHVLSGAVNGMAQTAIYSQPNVNVGGDYVSGQATIVSGHIGDTVGRDYISGTQHIGDTVGRDQVSGTLIGGDQIGRDRTDNSGIIHLGDQDRYTSPDNQEDNNTGCQNSDCSVKEPIP